VNLTRNDPRALVSPEPLASSSVETGTSWIVAFSVLFILTFSYGAPLVASVALKEIAADLGSARSTAALAASLGWVGSGLGAIPLGWIAERVGMRRMVVFGGIMIGAGLALSATGGTWQLLAGHGLLIGVLGSGAVNVPLMVYVSRWFDRRRGSALALVSSGQYVAGAIWPTMIAIGVEQAGWRPTMLVFGIATALAILPVALLCLHPPPVEVGIASRSVSIRTGGNALGMSKRAAFNLLSIAGFLCCVPMAMPSGHIVALCSDVGIRPAQGALMLSVLLGSAFISRQFWGWLSDRIGGLRTILAASICQAAALSGFLFTQDEVGLFMVAAAFGLGFSGIIPAYVLVLREIFPVEEASWRVPVWFFINLCGMAMGGWLAGFLYDQMGSYGPAFMAGIAFNLANIAVIGWLAAGQSRMAR
jgi:MFS family permease